MRLHTTLRWIVITLTACLLTACQNATVSGLFRPSETPVPPTATATLTSTPTETPTPTITPTPEPTLTPTPAMMTIEAGSLTAPILLYHHISTDTDKQGSRYNIDPVKFEEQVKWLYDNGYRTITVTDLANLVWQGGVAPVRPVVITFDDGNLNIFNYAFPILKKYGFVATFYVVENYIDKKDMVSADQLRELIQNGWEIGSHSMSHPHLTNKDTDLTDEIYNSKVEMEQWLGAPINSFAYPYGEMSPDIVTLVSQYGYTSAGGLGSSYVHGLNSIYYLSRIEVQNDYSMEQFISLLPWNGPLQ